ncbi:MAG TPA: hypothetical protein PKA88_35325, partial [Polyangiaceae bacterium]|nr:hypothetical protein [Polyangiaceae bacterium]
RNAEHMLRVIRNHRNAAYGKTDGYEALEVLPVALDHANCPDQGLVSLAKSAWDDALELGVKNGFRNAQVSVIAPTGTIGLVMDCDTTGIEPDFALVKFKKLAGGGYFKIINRSVPAALEAHKAKASDFDPPVPFAGHMSGAGAPAPDAPRFPLIQMILSGWPCSLQASVSRRATVKRFGLSLTEDVQSDLVQGDVRYAVSNVDYANLARRLCATLVQHAALNPRTTVQHDSTSVLGQLGAMRVPHGDDARIRILFQHVVDGSPRHAKTGWQLRHGIDSHGR